MLAKLAATGTAAAALAYAYYRSTRKRRVVITGGCGNLGTKLATRLLETGEWEVVLLEHPDYIPTDRARVPKGASVEPGDLTDGTGAWTAALRGADSLVHFSAVNPYPNASWEDSAGSMAHSCNLFLAAERAGVRRVVFASSNHVMGGCARWLKRAGRGAARRAPTASPVASLEARRGSTAPRPNRTGRRGARVASTGEEGRRRPPPGAQTHRHTHTCTHTHTHTGTRTCPHSGRSGRARRPGAGRCSTTRRTARSRATRSPTCAEPRG